MQHVVLLPKLCHLTYLVSKVSNAVFNIWLVTHINLSLILIIIMMDQMSSVEDHTTHIVLECHQDADNDRILNIRRSVSGIIHTLLGVSVCWKVQIQPAIASDSTDGEIRCMYNAVKKTKVIRRYMEALALYTALQH